MPQQQLSEKVLIFAIIVSMLFWGLSWPSGKVLIRYSSPGNLVVYRYLLVLLTLFPLLLMLKQKLLIKRQSLTYLLSSGVLLALYTFLFFLGLKTGNPGSGGVLVTTLNPVMAYAIGSLLTKKLPSRNEGLGLILGLLASVFLLQVWQHPEKILASGNAYFLLSALVWAVMSQFTSKAGAFGSSLSFSFWQYLVTLSCLLPLLNVQELKLLGSAGDSLFWFNLIFSSAIVTTLATTLYFYATSRLGPARASSFILTVPFAAAVSSWLLLGETLHWYTLTGGLLGISAIYLINKKSK